MRLPLQQVKEKIVSHANGVHFDRRWTRGQSPFARPVAAVTAFVRGLTTRRTSGDRELEDHYARAGDRHALEMMEREWDRRDGGGVRNWD